VRRTLPGVALGLAIAIVVACGGRQKPAPDWSTKLRMENQITALWTQIRDWRREARLNTEPRSTDLFEVRALSVPEAKAVCRAAHRVPAACEDICGLSTAICDNAEAICDLADQLGKQDDYAQEKCASGKASCREAKQKCCNCSAKPPEAAP
jgi:hypothetical protein